MLYFSLNRNKVFLVLSFLFLICSILVGYEVFYWNGLLPAASFIHNYTIRSMLENITYLILIFVLYYEFQYKKTYLLLWLLIFSGLLLLTSILSLPTAIVLSTIPFIVCLFQWMKGSEKSILLMFSLFMLFILNLLDDMDILENLPIVKSHYLLTSIVYKIDNLGLILFAIVMIFISAKGILNKTNTLNTAKLKLEQLEYQFLQKRILPHFLMNSLMSIQQLIAKDPGKASTMIEALGEEFHLLSEINKQKKIPLSKEIEICRLHLQIMSIQQNADFEIEVIGISGKEMIPPTVIHTLVENGITHGYTGKSAGKFFLSKEQNNEETILRLFNNGLNSTDETKKGTGINYIEARLEECFPGRWELHSKKVDSGWESVIIIKQLI